MTRETAFESEGALLSWAFITTRREALDWVSRSRRETRILSSEILQRLEQYWQEKLNVHSGDKLDALRQCLDSTPKESATILELRYSQDLTCDEVARQMNLTLSAVYKRLSRLHAALKLCIESKLQIKLPAEPGTL